MRPVDVFEAPTEAEPPTTLPVMLTVPLLLLRTAIDAEFEPPVTVPVMETVPVPELSTPNAPAPPDTLPMMMILPLDVLRAASAPAMLPAVTFPVIIIVPVELFVRQNAPPFALPPVTFPTTAESAPAAGRVTIFEATEEPPTRFDVIVTPAAIVSVPLTDDPLTDELVIDAHVNDTFTVKFFPFKTKISDGSRLAHVSQDPEPFAALFH